MEHNQGKILAECFKDQNYVIIMIEGMQVMCFGVSANGVKLSLRIAVAQR
ncbi:hypothetical protein HanXRQr2_Chr15g0720621 [Helianthus annuus]|uniref:Uncharacterized protein n=1 Tax=Helianthus annuus TaxID=4232 RepID=A0A9K3E4X2_HELAN|nr:hypothetical protein HanXRQr2_Chr15g0720621 [Helianthus annuus]KAJ0458376.1 hypothetical protein HanIR_Chr15g0784391 [Helianthus annuus]KAJ0833505.1 hypothetical protein HanPSC8_Chr15g0691151 [Helianthus annuus]